MKSDKSFIITLALIIIIIASLLFYYFSSTGTSILTTNNTTNKTNNHLNNSTLRPGNSSGADGSNSTNNSGTTLITLTDVKEYNDYFTINTLINEYYQSMIDDDKTAILNKLDKSYINQHQITKKNIKNYMERNYEDISFISKYIYVKGINDILYYFVNGEVQNYDFASEMLTEKNEINYLVIVDKTNGTYSITPLISDISIFNYAQEYKISSKNIESNNNNKYQKQNISDQNVAIYYLNYFKNLLYLNTEKAYSMLDSKSKSRYFDYEDFVINLEDIYSSLSTNLLSYSVNGEKGKRKYSIVSTNQKKVLLVEKSIMNFTITLPS
ncbi:MAG: hypothetical protein E7164_00950 [Firmicutes bacterium]|nr:hypothetical protein [Bacillota bacterium]